jgi:ABC-type multidrug transport system ATPase subunit
MSTATTGRELDRPTPQSHGQRGLRIDANGVGQTLRNGRRVLDDISLTIRPGQVVAIVGGSGAGKSTLLDALAGVRPASHGTIHFDRVDAGRHADTFRSAIGYVPQDDIIHRDLPLRSTLRYAAQLRLPTATPPGEIEALVDDALATLGLHDRGDVRVGHLSGGQRKRASIGVELLTRPRAFFLDEPTSGLDSATAHGLMRTLRRLADSGTTVVLTTHNTDDLRHCDHVVFLAHGGRLAYEGTLDNAKRHFDVSDVTTIYEHIADTGDEEHPRQPQRSAPTTRNSTAPATAGTSTPTAHMWSARPGPIRQWAVLTRRNLDALGRNRLSLAITFGSPALVIAMFAILFEPGAFDTVDPDPTAAVMIAFWTAFAGFFFGLTFGLLQICTEIPILRRERFVGLNLGAYLFAKLTVLLPVLAVVIGVMVAVLTALDRLPTTDAAGIAVLTLTLLLDAVAAAALGLLASAAVADPAQATLALPMLCFPAVLFSGAVIPTRAMTTPGRAIGIVTSDRWAFEAVARQLGLGRMAPTGNAEHALTPYGDALTGTVVGHWLAMAAFAAFFLAAANTVLQRRSTATRGRPTRR